MVIENIRFYRDVWNHDSFISTKSASGKTWILSQAQFYLKTKKTTHFIASAWNSYYGCLKHQPKFMRFRIYCEKNVFQTCSNDEIPYHTPFARPQLKIIKFKKRLVIIIWDYKKIQKSTIYMNQFIFISYYNKNN